MYVIQEKCGFEIIFFFSKDGDDKKRPVIIHRAVLGSVERMIAILAENYGGKWYVTQIQF